MPCDALRTSLLKLGWYLASPAMRDVYIALKQRLIGARREWEYTSRKWPRAAALGTYGWNVQAIIDTQTVQWPALVEQLKSSAPFAQPLESSGSDQVDLAFHNSIMSFGYALGLTAQASTSISFLDWGGGLGQYRLYAESLFSDLRIDYHCRDLPLLVTSGRALQPDAHFYDDDTCLQRTYDLVLVSSSLQYSPDWEATLSNLACATAHFLFVTLLPTSNHAPSYVFKQRPHRYGYHTEYNAWCINRRDLIRGAEDSGLKLIREFYNGYEPPIYKAPERCVYRGFLFRRIGDKA